MSNKQPEALRLAEQLHRVSTVCDHHYSLDRAAAVELERLHALNGELVEALKRLHSSHKDYTDSQARGWPANHNGYPDFGWSVEIETHARAVLAKAKAQQ